MKKNVGTTSNAEEMITISRAEYEALKEHNAELEQKLNWLTEQYILAKHGKYAFTSEQQEQLVMDGFGRTMNEAELFADAEEPEIPSEEELNAAVDDSSERKPRKRTGTVTDIVPEDTPVEVVEHRLEGDDLICPECGETMVEIGKADALKVLPMEQRRGSSPAEALQYFARIAAWEKKLEELTPEERYKQRQEKEKPILDALYAWADARKNIAPKSALGKALYYLREQRPYLERYLLDGRLEYTNNVSA